MKQTQRIPERIISLDEAVLQSRRWRLKSKTIAFTNGVFDILHAGHIAVLSQAAAQADMLIVGINSDASVKRLKGDDRPVKKEDERALIMASLLMVDAVVIFDEDTPLEVIKKIEPDVLVKGGDYSEDTIVGAKEVRAKGGNVVVIPLEEGYSTTALINKIRTK